jgi:hypothetical protein
MSVLVTALGCPARMMGVSSAARIDGSRTMPAMADAQAQSAKVQIDRIIDWLNLTPAVHREFEKMKPMEPGRAQDALAFRLLRKLRNWV